MYHCTNHHIRMIPWWYVWYVSPRCDRSHMGIGKITITDPVKNDLATYRTITLGRVKKLLSLRIISRIGVIHITLTLEKLRQPNRIFGKMISWNLPVPLYSWNELKKENYTTIDLIVTLEKWPTFSKVILEPVTEARYSKEKVKKRSVQRRRTMR